MTVRTDPLQRAFERADSVLAQMTLREKIGQMTQVEKNSITPAQVRDHAIGSVLSGGGGNPEPNTPETWRAMVMGFRDAALESRLGVPLIYGVDAVHGHNNVRGATIFPHNIGLGATRDADLVRRIARATALEVAATGVRWDFAPAVSIPKDIRWGRTYEGYAQDPDIVSELAVAFVEGLKGDDWSAPDAVLPSVKHYVADGATTFGTSTRMDRSAIDAPETDRTLANAHMDEGMRDLLERGAWTIDQGIAEISEDELRSIALAPYKAAIDAGALNVMASYSSWGGLRMHAHRYLLTDVLKGELGFEGFVVSDWEAIDQIDPDLEICVERSIGAGIDMVMVPFEFERFMDTLERLVHDGRVDEARVDDAVRRILVAKARLGLFDEPPVPPLDLVGCDDHRALAREAAARSQVLLKHDRLVLPLADDLPRLLVAGTAADDIGLQCGGWSVSWMGSAGPITPGTTLLDGLRERRPGTEIVFDPDASGNSRAPVGIVAIHEEPYAEGLGDRSDLRLSAELQALVARVRARVDRLVLVLYSGRPLVLGQAEGHADAVVAAWLPGSEGAGVADPLVGAAPYTGRLGIRWPRSQEDIPLHPFDPDFDPESDDVALWTLDHRVDLPAPRKGSA